ncbi:hypothetical protein [Streptomyces sp. NPDC005549]|uniref:hypothetical protein n=1 Tax=Streptomyces sp. NPDC005549 TaxID=3154888 RepID=UPI0033ACCC6D
MITETVIALGDERDTTYTVQTSAIQVGACTAEHGACGKRGVLAVRNGISQQRPAESSAVVITLCADHQDAAPRMHAAWVADARELQDPATRAEFLASAGVTG